MYALLVWKVTLLQETKPLHSSTFHFLSFFPGQLFSSGILVYPVWILVALEPWCAHPGSSNFDVDLPLSFSNVQEPFQQKEGYCW